MMKSPYPSLNSAEKQLIYSCCVNTSNDTRHICTSRFMRYTERRARTHKGWENKNKPSAYTITRKRIRACVPSDTHTDGEQSTETVIWGKNGLPKQKSVKGLSSLRVIGYWKHSDERTVARSGTLRRRPRISKWLLYYTSFAHHTSAIHNNTFTVHTKHERGLAIIVWDQFSKLCT